MQLSAFNSKIDLKNCFKRPVTGWKLYLTKIITSAQLVLGFITLTFASFGQNVGDYRSAATGDWNAVSTWERWNGAAWVRPTAIFPSVSGTATSEKTATTGTTHTVSLPAGIVSGDLLLIFWSDANDVTTEPTTPAGWTQLYTNTVNRRVRRTWYKIADGTEGTTLNIIAGAERSAHNSYRIDEGTFSGNPVAGVPSTANSNTPDPPLLISGFGGINTLWIAVSQSAGDDNAPTPTAPANYTNLISGYTLDSGNDHARVVSARRELLALSEDPAAFTLGSNVFHAANTVAISSLGVAGEGVPTSASGAITILSGDTVTVSAAVSADELTIGAGGQITVNSGQTFSIANGAGTDLTVNGTLSNAGTIANAGTIEFGSGGTYTHNQNGGTVPIATWDASSTCEITGVVATDPTNTTQNFGNFIWNCPNQTGTRLFQGDNAFSIQGDLTITSTGSGELWLRDDKANIVGGDFTQTGGILANRFDGVHSLTVNGDFALSGGTLRNDGNATNGGVLNVAGDFSHTGGTLAGGSLLNIFFTGSTQTFTRSSATNTGTIHMTINSGADVNIGTSQMVCEDFTLSAGGTIQTTVTGLATLGQVAPTGDATTDGTITANFVGFVPTMGDMITVISMANSYTGTPTLVATSITHDIDITYSGGVLLVGTVVLPIELISFEGKAVDQSVQLTWRTASELNNAYMAVERSVDGRKFEELGRVDGVGTTFEPQEYSFIDKFPFPGTNYYRLRQVDYDGAFEYHKTISVKIDRNNNDLNVQVFPNPAQESIQATWLLDTQKPTTLQIFNTVGQLVATYLAPADLNSYEVPLNDLAKGLYFLQASQGQKVEVIRFRKQ